MNKNYMSGEEYRKLLRDVLPIGGTFLRHLRWRRKTGIFQNSTITLAQLRKKEDGEYEKDHGTADERIGKCQ